MRKFCWQRWALIVMLVSRLVIGELGHAMPLVDAGESVSAHHHQMAVEHGGQAIEAMACHTELPASDHAAHGCDTDSSHHSSTEQDCCKTGECECPCLHVPCDLLEALVLAPLTATSLLIPPAAEGIVSRRPSGLFRPPA